MTFARIRPLRLRQQFLWFFLLLLSCVLALFFSLRNPAIGSERTEILWDSWGVPHIYGKMRKGYFKPLVGRRCRVMAT
jgi:acyl-homoserine lactone acylase PvdQ